MNANFMRTCNCMNNGLDPLTIAKVTLLRILWVSSGLFYGYRYGFQPDSILEGI